MEERKERRQRKENRQKTKGKTKRKKGKYERKGKKNHIVPRDVYCPRPSASGNIHPSGQHIRKIKLLW